MRTASPRARWRNRCALSSREVKSTGVKFFVVILPSTVIANVTATSGLLEPRRGRARRINDLLFLLADLMLERRHLFAHLAHPYMADHATGSVEEIDNPARGRTDKNDEKAERTNQVRDALA